MLEDFEVPNKIQPREYSKGGGMDGVPYITDCNLQTRPTPGVGQKGLPLGNLTSQLLVNIYMNEFDQWVKHTLKATYYVRYADDFVFFSSDRAELERMLPRIRAFLTDRFAGEPSEAAVASYRGMLKHGNAHRLGRGLHE